METQGFFSELLGYITGEYTWAYLVACIFFASIGYGVSHYFKVKKAVKKQKETEDKPFSFKFWVKDNITPILVFIGVVYVGIYFSNELIELIKLHGKDAWYANIIELIIGTPPLLGLMIGLLYENLISKKIRKLVNSKFKKGDKKEQK